MRTTASTWTRLALAAAVALVGTHVVMLVVAAQRAFAFERADYEPLEFAIVGFGTLVIAWTLFVLFRARVRAIGIGIAVVAASAVLSPGAVAVVALFMLNAHVAGVYALRFVQGGRAWPAVPWPLATLAGIALGIGLISVTAAMKVHYSGVYAIALVAPLLLGWRETRAALLRSYAFAAAPVPHSTMESGWIALLVAVFTLYAFMVARPEVGYDAQTMHMQIAMLMQDSHRFRFDVGRYLWAVMPMGADWAYAFAFVLGGEPAARGTNLAFAILACAVVYAVARRHASREVALAMTTLLASTPLMFAETASLYVENLLGAFLMAALLAVLAARDATLTKAQGIALFALFAAGAMQTKIIGVLWLAPLGVYGAWVALPPPSGWPEWRTSLCVAVAAAIGAFPYVNAWLRTGNPVFPFMNRLFRSPLTDTTTSFDNPMYRIPLGPTSLHDVLLDGHRFLEGADGAAGLHWLLVIPLVVIALVRRQPPRIVACAALFALYFVAVFTQQAYLRYLFPAFLLLAALGAWATEPWMRARAARVALLVVGGVLVALNVRFIPSGNWPNAQLCPMCAFDRFAREDFTATYMGDRIVGDYLNRNLRDARVGFLMVNAPSPAGYVGYSRAANWHDGAFYPLIAAAKSADDIDAAVRKFGLTYVVYRTMAPEMENQAIRDYRATRTEPVWKYRDFVVARVLPAPA
jgi:hypothetical protein